MTFLLDTNIVSEVRKETDCNSGVASWYSSVQRHELYLSALVVGEIRKGIEQLRRRNDSQQVAVLEVWLQSVVREFGERVLAVDAEVAEAWGRLYYNNDISDGNAIDALLAATAQVHDLTLVTRNTRDFEGLGVALLNPFN